MSIWVGRELSQAWWITEVIHRQCSQDGDDDIVMGEIGVEWLICWESQDVVVNGVIDWSVGASDQSVIQSCEKFLHPAYALGTTSRIAIGVIVVVYGRQRGLSEER